MGRCYTMKDNLSLKMETLNKEHDIMRDRLHDLSGIVHSDSNRIVVLEEKSDIHRVAINGLDKAREEGNLRMSKIENDNIHMVKFIENISKSLDNFADKFEISTEKIVAEIAKLKEDRSAWSGVAGVLKFIGYFVTGSIVTFIFEHITK